MTTDPGKATERLLWALQERAKELACLYRVEELLDNPERPLKEVFEGLIEAIPPGWQYPEICEAAVEYEGERFSSPTFVGSPWVQGADIVVQERVVGRIDVYYRQEMPQADEGPFLKEEGKLIRTIADRLSHFILHQQLRALQHDMQAAQDALAEHGTEEWRIALNLLRRTDQELFVRVARKMANHLAWSGIAEAPPLLHSFGGVGGKAEETRTGEQNQPSRRLPVDDSLELADRVFQVAGSYLADHEILESIEKWMHEDRASFLMRTVISPHSSPSEIADAIRRYQHLVPAGTGLSEATMHSVLVGLIRRFLSEEPQYLSIAKEYIELADMLALLEKLIWLPGSRGRFGGKAAGLFLASRILTKTGGKAAGCRVPRTWYLATDTMHAFVLANNLEEVYEQKYKDLHQVRLEYSHLVQVFKNSQFPPEVVKGLSMVLDDLPEVPLIVRSSSLLEDRLGAAFSGKYKSLFLPNRGSKAERLAALLDAIAEVYASVFGPDPIQYRAERGLLDLREEMGIMIQEVVGAAVGHYYFPAFAGVALSNNEFRWSARIRREDGLIRMVPGLGTRAVDRVRDDYPVLVAPGQPALRVNATPDEVMRYAPRYIDVIDLNARSLRTLDIASLLRECGEAYPGVQEIVSVRDGDRLSRRAGLILDFSRDELVVTFEGLIESTPMVGDVAFLLSALEDRLGHPVEIEFASDGTHFNLLQCRPQTPARGAVPVRIPEDIPAERVLFTANRYVSNGLLADITHIVYVDSDAYDRLVELEDLLAVGRTVSRLNALLPKRQFILMGPGRWGSRGDVKLGVQVTYSDISNSAMLVEIARKRGSFLPDLSFGTHFFQDLVEAAIRYLPLYPDDPDVRFAETFFREAANELTNLLPESAAVANVVRVIDIPRATGGKVLQVLMNAEEDHAVAMLVEPGREVETVEEERAAPMRPAADDHWRWRLRMAEQIAAKLDAKRFGVAALYLIGSTKNAAAGVESDIDLLVHFRGEERQRADLELWLEGWSRCLDEINYLRTGHRRDGLLDLHFVSDADIAARTSFAVKIGAVTDAAWPLPLKQSG
jgi:hypothetical protein